MSKHYTRPRDSDFYKLAHSAAAGGDGADQARPAPGVLEALDHDDIVVIAPSNPLVSIGCPCL